MDEFKKYLRDQKDPLELEEPSKKVWEGIQASIKTPVKQFAWRNYAVAASLILLVGLGILQLNKTDQTTTIVKSTIPTTIAPIIDKPVSKTSEVPSEINTLTKAEPIPVPSPITTIHTVKELHSINDAKLISMENSFTQVISLQKARINTTPIYAESPKYFSEFHHQLQQMEKDEAQIKTYINKNGMSDELLDQLINVYQQKLNLLKLLQTEMQKLNSRYKQNRPAVDTLNTYFLNL